MAGISRAYKRRGNMVANTGGPVLCLDAGSLLSYPGSGTTWTDLSGNGRNGTLVWNPTFSSENGGQIVLDGTGDHVVIGNCLPLKWQNITAISYEVVFKTIGSTFSRQYVVESRKSNGTPVYCWYVIIVEDNNKIVTGTGNHSLASYTDSIVSLSDATIPGKIFHVAQTIDKTQTTNNFKTYINGSLADTRSFNYTTVQQGSDPYEEMYLGGYFGALANDTQFKLKGSLYMYRAYKDRVLSAAEISQNFNLLRGRYGI